MADSKLDSFPVQRSELESKYWYNANFNPYGNPYVSDCLVRAFSAALMMKYRSVCKRLGIGLKAGFGGEANEKTHAGVAFREYCQPTDFDFIRKRLSIRDFISACGKDPAFPYGIYVAFAAEHAVYVCAVSPQNKYFIDTWDSSGENVLYAVRVIRQVPPGSPERLTLSEFRRTQEAYSDPAVQAKFRKMAEQA